MAKEDVQSDIDLSGSFGTQHDTYETVEGNNGELKLKHTDKHGVVRYTVLRPEAIDPRFRKLIVEDHDFEGVVAKADEILKIDPKDKSALFHKADAQYHLGNHEEAIKTYDQLIGMEVKTEQDKKDKATYINNKACSLAAMGNEDEAHKLFKEAHGLDPTSPTIASNVAVGYAIRQDYAKALEYTEKALANGPEDDEQREILESMKAHYESLLEQQNRPVAAAGASAGAPDPTDAVS